MKTFGLLATLLWCLNAAAAGQTMSFTPLSVKVPLRGVFIEGTDASGNRIVSGFRDCRPTTPDDCLVDLADSSSLDALSEPQSIAVGTYKKITVATCINEGIYRAKVTGIVQINGSTYYTTSGSDPLSQNISDLGPVTVTFHGCQRDYQLPVSVNANEGHSVEVSLFFPIKNVAWASLEPSVIPEGCTQNAAGTQSVCLGYPDATPYVGHTEPTLETYSIYELPNTPDTADGQVLLIFDSHDLIIGGSTRRYFAANSLTGHANFDTPVRIASKNGDGSFHIENFGSTASSSYVIFPSFKRQSHIGTFISETAGSAAFDYGALKLP